MASERSHVRASDFPGNLLLVKCNGVEAEQSDDMALSHPQ
jgi:hypothetical protein